MERPPAPGKALISSYRPCHCSLALRGKGPFSIFALFATSSVGAVAPNREAGVSSRREGISPRALHPSCCSQCSPPKRRYFACLLHGPVWGRGQSNRRFGEDGSGGGEGTGSDDDDDEEEEEGAGGDFVFVPAVSMSSNAKICKRRALVSSGSAAALLGPSSEMWYQNGALEELGSCAPFTDKVHASAGPGI